MRETNPFFFSGRRQKTPVSAYALAKLVTICVDNE